MNRIRLGIFGGTFDPPHVGHLILAQEASDQLQLTKVHWVLTPFPPHKSTQKLTGIENRLELLEAAIGEDSNFVIDRTDINRPPPHYAVDTVRQLRVAFPEAELVYLMGGDSLDDLPNWHAPQAFLAACDWIGVMRRPGEFINLFKLEQAVPGISEKVEFLSAPFVEISSTHIRKRISEGGAYRYYLPPPVYQIIRDRQLYQHQSEQ